MYMVNYLQDTHHVREYNGSPANMIWFWVDGNRYDMSYNDSTEQIEPKEKKTQRWSFTFF